jgi:fumarylacetoacetase
VSALAFGVLRDHGPAVRAGAGALPLAGLPLPVPPETWERPSLNAFLELGAEAWDAACAALPPLLADRPLAAPDDTVLPFEVADYVDFFAARAHAENAGRILRPGTEPLTPNWEHMPVGYHGRAGTVVVSGTPVHRPFGPSAPRRPRPPRASDRSAGSSWKVDRRKTGAGPDGTGASFSKRSRKSPLI